MWKRASFSVLAVVVAVGAGVILSVKPWQSYNVERAKRDIAVDEMRAAEQERAKEIERFQRLQTPFGREEEARKLGYRRPDEKPVETGS